MLPRTGNGEPLLIKKFLYAQYIFDVFVPIHALPGAALDWFELGELSFPETQDIRGQTTQLSNFSDAKIKLVRDHHVGGLGGFGRGFVARAHWGSRSGLHRSCASLPIRVSSTTGPSEQPLIFRENLFLCVAALQDQQKTPGEVLLSRGFSEFLLVRSIVSRTVSVSFSWQPFSLLA